MSFKSRMDRLERSRANQTPPEAPGVARERFLARLAGIRSRLLDPSTPRTPPLPRSEMSLAERLAVADTPAEIQAVMAEVREKLQAC